MAHARRHEAISTAWRVPRREPGPRGAPAGGYADLNQPDTTHAFDGKAEAYARHRRDYSPVAIEAIIAVAGLGKASVIADLGAGTGMLTRHFTERVGRVFAIEPNDDMRSLALASLGQRESLCMMKGTAQETGLPDHSVDAVTAGRAIQWFEPAPAQAEIRRILRPGGWLIVVRTPVTDAYSRAALERLRDELISRHDRTARQHQPHADVGDYFGGDNCIRLAYPCAAQESWPEFLGRLQSLSFSPQPGDARYAGFERTARAIFDAGAVDGMLRVEYATEVMMKQIVPPARTPHSLAFSETEIERDIVTRFEQVAAMVPASTALKSDGEAWTYAQLDALANRIAQIVLRESPDQSRPVALLFDHGIGGVASIMGVLKAGRAYCALSPAHPAERQRECLADLQSTLLLCAESRLGMARNIAPQGLHCVAIDPRDLHGSDQRPDVERRADDIVAIYYTSGTTGRPKGVMLSHRCLLHRVWLSARLLRIEVGDPMSQFAEIGFVTAAADVFVALLTGATICPFDARKYSLRQMATWLNRECIAIVRMPVALFQQFVDALDETDRFPHVRFIQPAGKLLWTGVDRYRRHFGRGCRLLRQLAATETWAVAMMTVDHDTPRIGATVPVGYPVPGKAVWLEDGSGAPVGVGEVGEIVVRSNYLYSGIWRRPETSLPPGQTRVHRMGDLGRWLPDGSLEFVGRTDSRVKIRGFTVDLEQVEAAIGDTGLVIDAAVVANEGESHQAHLVAWFVPASPRATAGEIRARLVERVPGYMIPSRFVALDALPLTPNGKIDRAALPNAGRRRPEPATALVAPRTPMETSVGAIWTDVLKIDPLGIDDDFLELGGDSLMAARIASRILAAFQVDLGPRDLFDAPTVARMAELIARRQRESTRSGGAVTTRVAVCLRWTCLAVAALLCGSAGTLAGGATSAATPYPVRPIRLIVPLGPGGTVDLLSRVLGERLETMLGAPVVVENKAGANGIIGTEFAKRAAPDGYTLLAASTSTQVMTPHVVANLPYDALQDFVPVINLAYQTKVVLVSTALGVATLGELVALARSQPGKLNYASVGVGSSAHLDTEQLAALTGIELMHIPYRGSAQNIAAISANEVQVLLASVTASHTAVAAGRVRALAVMADRRSPLLPGVPTMVEAGLPRLDVQTWIGILAPAGTPPPIVEDLNQALNRVVRSPDFRAWMEKQGLEPIGGSPEAFGAEIRADFDKWGKVTRGLGIRPQ